MIYYLKTTRRTETHTEKGWVEQEKTDYVGFTSEGVACDSLMEEFIDDVCCVGTGEWAGVAQPGSVDVFRLTRVSAIYGLFWEDGSITWVRRTVTDIAPDNDEDVRHVNVV